MAAEQMLGSNFENEDKNDKTNSKSGATHANNYDDTKLVEDEIALSERLKQKDSVITKKKGSINDIVEDFDTYSDDGFDNPDKKLEEDDYIIDEVADDDYSLKMLEDVISASAANKKEISKVKDVISRIDEMEAQNARDNARPANSRFHPTFSSNSSSSSA